MVQFRKRFVSGHRFSDAAKRDNSERLKPLGLAHHSTAAKACALYLPLAACLKACPDTNLASNCSITSLSCLATPCLRCILIIRCCRSLDLNIARSRPHRQCRSSTANLATNLFPRLLHPSLHGHLDGRIDVDRTRTGGNICVEG